MMVATMARFDKVIITPGDMMIHVTFPSGGDEGARVEGAEA
jgi:hypothetical protein